MRTTPVEECVERADRQLSAFSRQYWQSLQAIRQVVLGLTAGGKLDTRTVQRVSATIYAHLEQQGKVVYVPPHDASNPIIVIGERVVDLGHDRLHVVAMG